jgi:RimJ/RimL family protein N-acetyltransferase
VVPYDRAVELEDEAVRLRPFTLDDVPAVTDACRDAEIGRWTTVAVPYTEENARAWIAGQATSEHVELAIVERASDRLTGAIGLMFGRPGVGELGYWAVPELRGRGYTTRALRLLAAWAFADRNLARLQLMTFPGNRASERVAEKVGFKREGLLRAYAEQRGERKDAWMWSLLPGELR